MQELEDLVFELFFFLFQIGILGYRVGRHPGSVYLFLLYAC
jgi:hypothetical protein